MAALATYADNEGICEPSQATLAKRLDRSRPWVNRVISDLAGAGLLRKQARSRSNGGTTSCRYQLAQTPEQVRAFTTAIGIEVAVPEQTGARSAADRPSHRDDTSHADLKQIQITRPRARSVREAGDPQLPPSQPEQRIRKEDDLAEPARDWLPSDEAVAEALRLCPDADLDEHTARFVSRCRAKGYRYARLDDAWLDWLLADCRDDRRAAAAQPLAAARRRPRPPRQPEHRFDRFDAWATAATSPRAAQARC
jgi:hypothetical protein